MRFLRFKSFKSKNLKDLKAFYKYLMFIIMLVLLIIIYKFISYLVNSGAINKTINETLNTNETLRETLTNIINENSDTSHSVNLPLTQTYDCKNFCNPSARCAITGQQCFTDIDCPGCQPKNNKKEKPVKDCIPGLNDGGKLTTGLTPQFSSLVAGYGTQETILNDISSIAPKANFGIDVYSQSFNETQEIFNKRYKPKKLNFMPNYKPLYTLTGDYIVEEPYPSNY